MAGVDMIRYLVEKGAIPGVQAGLYNPVGLLVDYLRCGETDSDIWTARIDYVVDELVDTHDFTSNSDRLLRACLPRYAKDEVDHKARLKTFERFVERGAKAMSCSVLAGLIMNGASSDFVTRFLNKGLDGHVDSRYRVNYGDFFTALQAAAQQGYLELVTMLVERGANVNAPARGPGGFTALQGICL